MHEIFISYSSADSPFVTRLADQLEQHKTAYWRDVKDALHGDLDAQIKTAIQECVVFLFVISPMSLTSKWCQLELSFARLHNKRILAVMRRFPSRSALAAHWKDQPEGENALANADYICRNVLWADFREKREGAFAYDAPASGDSATTAVPILAESVSSPDAEAFDPAFAQLLKSIQAVPDDERLRRFLSLQAVEFQKDTKDTSSLLRGQDLKDAEAWRARTANVEPNTLALIDASIINRRRERRLRRGVTAGFLLVVIGLIVVGGVAWVTEQFRQLNAAVAAQTDGVNAFRGGNYEDARGFYADSLAYLEQNPHMLTVAGWFGVAINLDDWHRNLGTMCAILEDFACAETHLQEAIRLMTPETLDPYMSYAALGLIYLQQEPQRTADAQSAFDQAVAAARDDFQTFAAHYLIARATLITDYPRVRAAQIIERYENSDPILNILHASLMQAIDDNFVGEPHQIIQLKSIFVPYQLDVWYTLAASYEDTGQPERACDLWRQYTELALQILPLWHTLGDQDRMNDATTRIQQSTCFKGLSS